MSEIFSQPKSLLINGGKKLKGELEITSAKNATLPIIAASLMSSEDILLKNCPRLTDLENLLEIIRVLGGVAEFRGDDIFINAKDVKPRLVSKELTQRIRASIFILGSLLARFKEASIYLPGGCNIGARAIDLHIKGLKKLGVSIKEEIDILHCTRGKLKGTKTHLSFPSVGATENLMMAATLAEGTTTIINAAREPEIIDLANFINALGGKVQGAGTGTIYVHGVRELKGAEYRPIGDRIIAGTYLTACAITGGDIVLRNANSDYLSSMLIPLLRANCEILTYSGLGQGQKHKSYLRIRSSKKLKAVPLIETKPYPLFPTDVQPQFTAMLAFAKGTSTIRETLFENRFAYVDELKKFGADLTYSGQEITIKGKKNLHPAKVRAEDLRGGAALTIATLGISGESVIQDIHHIDRGYFKIENDLKTLGADIKRV
ncbi:MAG: UDP-N-acetylglucosamine 1-carboxyvinyltransferase [Firmicutes bacterium]|nr:UDP-N-acetylglucosamine 1-carboxyvinyltransferase [Bacillota bacterium]MCL2256202.1 UDP-N-acetylglucosamine 1-carboxyvinyltransferase [Bacillota bacterium]